MKSKNIQMLLEQVALIFASFIWTAIVLVAVTLFWAYQDLQDRWEFMLNAPPEALAQALPTAPVLVLTVTPTPTPWAGPPPTLTPTATKPPTPTATRVVPLPEILPETLNPDDPVPVIVHTAEEVAELNNPAEPDQIDPVSIDIQPTPTPVALQEVPPPVEPPAEAPAPVPATPTPAPPPVVANPPIPGDNPGIDLLIPTRLIIESVGIDSKIIPVGWNVISRDGQEYSIWEVADYAVGWHKTSAILGQPGNTVMAGHHNVNGEVFRDLVNVEVGDKVVVYANDKVFEYRIDLKTIVKEKGEPVEVRRRNAQWIAPTDDERITLVTCWPYTNNTHRVIVVLKPL
jgi:sortase A